MKKKSTRKPLPTFRSEREEREFWQTHDSTDYDVPYQSLIKMILAEKIEGQAA